MKPVVVLCSALVACAKTSAEPAPVPRPVRTTPGALFRDFTNPTADSLVLANKYRAGATFTATIKTVGAEQDGTPVVWIDVDGENLMTLDFAGPAPAGLRAGDRITVTCHIGGASGALMIVTGCTSS